MGNEVQLEIGEVFPINQSLAGLVPMATLAEQAALTGDIQDNGLNCPGILWKKELIDGRCRQKACSLSGIPMRAESPYEDLTYEEVVEKVKSLNTRRNLTMAQKIMTASRTSRSDGSASLDIVAKSWGISRRTLATANYVSKARPDFVEPLFNGLTVDIIDAKGKATKTNKISAIHAYIKREEENVTEADSGGIKTADSIRSQAGKDWYFDLVDRSMSAREINECIAELANFKYPI